MGREGIRECMHTEWGERALGNVCTLKGEGGYWGRHCTVNGPLPRINNGGGGKEMEELGVVWLERER